MRKYIKKLLRVLQSPTVAIVALLWRIRSRLYSKYINDGGGRIIINDPSLKLKIQKGQNAKLNLYGDLIIESFKNSGPVIISISDNATLNILGDFVIGDGVKISIMKNGGLTIGGKKFESASGITGNTLIMVEKKIEIGYDFICAWDVFISDSDWHSIENNHHQKDIKIGDHVWIANNTNILKGTVIGNNCVVSSCSKISNKVYGDNLLIGGIPAIVLKENISWKRDIL